MEIKKFRIPDGVEVGLDQKDGEAEITVTSILNKENTQRDKVRNISTWLLSKVVKDPLNSYINSRKANQLAEVVLAKDSRSSK